MSVRRIKDEKDVSVAFLRRIDGDDGQEDK